MPSGLYAFWFRRDLRLHDNAGLYQLMRKLKETDDRWIGIFHLNPDFNESIDKRYDYYFQSLSNFLRESEKAGMPIQLVTGTVEEAMKKLIDNTTNLKGVYFNKDESGYGALRDYKTSTYLEINNIKCKSFVDAHLLGAEEVYKKDGTAYKVFTPYFKAWKQVEKAASFSVSEKTLAATYAKQIGEVDPKGNEALSAVLNKTSGTWKRLGEKAALKQLDSFVSTKLSDYNEKRDIPAENGTSKLSAYLKTGVLGIRTVYEKAMEAASGKGKETFIQELAWRDFYNMIYKENPMQKSEEIQEQYRELKWNEDNDLFKTWCDGKTGFPIVDAGMRQLNEEGWMHNRLRMITASFLTKDYLIDWRKGEGYFALKLIDYDPASNIGGWQWAASVGTDAVPYFRIFNPVTQSKRFDSEGEYIRKYVKELEQVEPRFIHEPWKMNEEQQKKASCIIGEDYPNPMIDHQVQRKKAIERFEEAKNNSLS